VASAGSGVASPITSVGPVGGIDAAERVAPLGYDDPTIDTIVDVNASM
jgi:hypothetical protein